MQLKTKLIRGQCRGHPLIRGSGRDGPELVVSRQSSVVSHQSSVVSRRSAVFGRRSAVRSWQLAVINLEFEILNLFGIWNFEFGIFAPETKKFRCSLARDWITLTCSESLTINRCRGKYRWERKEIPALGGGVGLVCTNV
jgi:hypothetical protein